jgi:hypothetical protein
MNTTYAFGEKIEARQETIINTYRRFFHPNLPKNRQYWTLCASCASGQNELLPGCELDQIKQAGLLQSDNQFHGVDVRADVIDRNRTAIPQAHWYCGKFYDTLVRTIANGTFNPGVINYDTLLFSNKGCASLLRLLHLASDYSGVLVIGNFILRCRYFQSGQVSDVIEALNSQALLPVVLKKGWEIDDKFCKAYVYTGASRTTKMVSIVFYKA